MQVLPFPWIDSLFARMLVRYGSAWVNLWEGVDMLAVKTDWATELGGLTNDALKYGVVNLPLDKPPTLGQFKALCLRSPVGVQQRLLNEPKADPERVARIIASLRAKLAKRPPLQWAYDLQERSKRGESMTIAQEIAWREALTTPAADVDSKLFRTIDPENLPPAMRPRQAHEESEA